VNRLRAHADRLRHDPLYRNSGHLMMSMVITSGAGFLFWQLCARLLNQHDVGIAATLISSAMLLATFGLVGMDMAVLHYMHRWPDSRGETASTGLAVVALTTALGAIVFVLGARTFVPSVRITNRDGTTAGKIELGSGAAAPDVELYREQANVLKTRDQFVTTKAISIMTKAGTPSDSDVELAVDGTMVIDTSNHRIYVRSGGRWKSVAVA